MVNNHSSERIPTTVDVYGKGKTHVPVPLLPLAPLPLSPSDNNSTHGSAITTPSKVSA